MQLLLILVSCHAYMPVFNLKPYSLQTYWKILVLSWLTDVASISEKLVTRSSSETSTESLKRVVSVLGTLRYTLVFVSGVV